MNESYENQRVVSDNTFAQGVPLIYNALNIDFEDPEWRWEVSSFSEDTKQSTDIKLINIPSGLEIMVAYRMRTEGYIDRYPIDITFRYGNVSMVPSEFQKVMAGAAHMGLYGFTDTNNNIVRWIVISFFGLRSVHYLDEEKGIYVPLAHIRQLKERNTAIDDTSFVAYKSVDFRKHDDNPTTAANERIILGTSAGYFEDIIELPATYGGAVPGGIVMKDKTDRIDRY